MGRHHNIVNIVRWVTKIVLVLAVIIFLISIGNLPFSADKLKQIAIEPILSGSTPADYNASVNTEVVNSIRWYWLLIGSLVVMLLSMVGLKKIKIH